MEERKTSGRFSPEVRERAVRLVRDHEESYDSQWAAMCSIAAKIGCSPETLRKWVRQTERDTGERAGPTTVERARIKELERENRELKQANEILRKASAFFGSGGARPPTEEMIAFIDKNRSTYGVEPICRVLPIAPSTYYEHAARRREPDRRPAREKRDETLSAEIQRIWDENFSVYGARKIWRQLKRDGDRELGEVARCTVERLMRRLGIAGAVRGKRIKTTRPEPGAPCPLDRVQRAFQAPRPNALWLSDFTYVATWRGFAYVAFVIDAYARRIVGWRASTSMSAQFVLDALEQALWDRRPGEEDGLVHHSDRGSQYLSIKYTERLAEAGVEPSVGSVGDSYDNALAETVIGLFKTEVIHRGGPWRSCETVEYATLEWVDWFNNRRLLSSIGYRSPAEAEARYWKGAATPIAA
ncbi:MAG: IS3 family transposase [Pseudomonadota bacterium]